MVFDLINTQQASHNFIRPELTNCSISIELKFSLALPTNIKTFLGEKTSTISVDTADVCQKSYSNKLMDEDDNNCLIQRCQKLKHKYRGVFSVDNFPSKLKSNTFLTVIESKSETPGTH